MFNNKITYDTLTQEQRNIADYFTTWLDSNEIYLSIIAEAGTGKSYLTNYLYNTCFKQFTEKNPFKYTNFHLTATTNRAAVSLAEYVSTQVNTIHSLLHITVYNDLKSGETSLKYGLAPEICNAIILIDECSMIDRKLLKAILTKTRNCKFIFVGDDKQLAPVKENKSPVFSLGGARFTLTRIMRINNSQDLLNACKVLRQNIVTHEFNLASFKNNQDIILCSKEEFYKNIDKYFSSPNNISRILTYTNSATIAYNDYCTKLRNSPQYYVDGWFINNNHCTTSVKDYTLYAEQEVNILKVNLNNIEKDSLTDLRYYNIFIGEYPAYIKVPVDVDEYKSKIKFYRSKKDWVAMFHLINDFSDLRSRDASTVHKAQGMSLNNVFIDLIDILTCKNKDTLARLLYVACSRAREKIFIRVGE